MAKIRSIDVNELARASPDPAKNNGERQETEEHILYNKTASAGPYVTVTITAPVTLTLKVPDVPGRVYLVINTTRLRLDEAWSTSTWRFQLGTLGTNVTSSKTRKHGGKSQLVAEHCHGHLLAMVDPDIRRPRLDQDALQELGSG
ncbi:hypothetical protein E4U53_005419 [Claviceps sorghi]|nr:hypothetical protein E4U53_005419 [Claviceps sorghi]